MHLPSWLTRLRLRTLLLTGFGITAFLTLLFYLIVMDIEMEFPLTELLPPIDSAALAKPAVHVGVISRYPPTIMFRGYQPIMDYLTAHTPYRFELLLGRDYNEALEHLVAHRVAAVFLGSYLYVRAHELYGVVPVLKPLNENRQPLSRSALIVRENSSIRSLGDLAGRTLALPSAESFSANWLADELLPHAGLSLADLGRVQNFSHHHTVIAQVLNGTFDAGVTRELLVRDAFGSGLRIVALSDPIPSSPLAVLPDADSAVTRAMCQALLAVNRDEQLRTRLTREWDVEFVNGFVDATDADYEVVRRIVRIPPRGRLPR
jgi:phosphonate transport system substrate-binding protein